MFESLRDAFREAVKNFKEELHRDDVPEVVDGLVQGMKREAADARARLRDLEDGIKRAKAEAGIEANEREKCRRRERMATSIGDTETAKLAAVYAERHERRHVVLVEKVTALEKELELRRVEADEMVEKIRSAEKERDSLAASVGRTQARESVRGGDPLFDELDRMADIMSGGKRAAPANTADDVDDVLNSLDSDVDARLFDEEVKPRDTDMEARLAELKRRMNEN